MTWTVGNSAHGKSKGGCNKTELRERELQRGYVYDKVQALTSVYVGIASTSNTLKETQAEVAGSAGTGAPQPGTPALCGDSESRPPPRLPLLRLCR